MQNEASIKKVIRKTLSDHFDHIRILRIDLEEGVDSYGDDVLKINVVFEGSPKDLDPKKLSGTVRLLRPELNKIHESAFPLLSFISKADYEACAS